MLIFVWASAQINSPLANHSSAHQGFQLAPNQSNYNVPQGNNTSTISKLFSRWYNYAATMESLVASGNLSTTYLFPDTQITAEFGTSYGTPWMHAAAVVFDPMDTVYTVNAGLNIDATMPYTIDSVGIYCQYVRNTSSSVVDTLIVEFLAESGSNMPNYYFTGLWTQTSYGVDTLFFKGLQRTGSFLNNANTIIVKYPLTSTSVNDTIANGMNYFKIGPSSPIAVSAGKVVAVTYQFKPGYSYIQNDTLNDKNYLNMYSYEENGSNTFPFYTKSSSSQSYTLPSWARFDPSSSWSSLYVPSVAFVQSFGFENHLVDFKVSALQTVYIPDLVITEINYNGPESGSDTTEFIEIYNNDTVNVDLTGFHFVQGVNYTFPSVTISAGDYIVVAVDSVKFTNFFGVAAYEWTSGGLSNGGEDIILVTNAGDTVDIVDYDDSNPWPGSAADGGGHSITFCNLSLDNNDGTNWSVATNFVDTNAVGDSIWANPGTGCGSIPPPSSDTIPPVTNNAMANSATNVNVYFSEPVDTSAEVVTNYTGLGSVSSAVRNANGDMVTLTLATALMDGAAYTLTVANVKDTANNSMVAPQSFNIIFNGTTAKLLLTEIMYNDLSATDSLEYFEIFNKTGAAINIGGFEITEGVHYTFPANTMIASGDYLVIAKDSALVNSVFGITGTYQWDSGGLKNSGEDIEIQNSLGDTIVYVDYDDSSPWPVEGDGDGPSIEYCDLSVNAIDNNNDGSYWTASINFVSLFNGDSIFGTPGTGCVIISIENKEHEASAIRIYPNPANDIINILTDGNEYEVKIYNVAGSLVKEIIINDSNTVIDLSSMKKGMYYLQFVDNKASIRTVKKLIVR
jgi:hypothetical protein